jgi:sec-independent protein translocase protein TatA
MGRSRVGKTPSIGRVTSPYAMQTGRVTDLGWPELLIVAAIAMLLFGTKKMPDVARSIGRSMRIVKAELSGLQDEPAPVATAPVATAPVATAPVAPAPAAVADPQPEPARPVDPPTR